MPELPEVETIRRGLAPRLTGRTVSAVSLRTRSVLVVPGDPAGGFSRNTRANKPPPTPKPVPRWALLRGQTFVEPRRHGKQLALVSAEGPVVLVHLGMTGQLIHRTAGERLLQTDHVHAMWRLDDGSRLVFRDPRRFGGLWAIATQAELDTRWSSLGPDAARLRPADLETLSRAHRPLKAALLDQTVLAGVGNIYADEACFQAGLAPHRDAASLTDAERARLAAAITEILAAAIDAKGSTLRDYRDADGQQGTAQMAHVVYGRGGHPCRVCGTPLEMGVLAQRRTVWCPVCQLVEA